MLVLDPRDGSTKDDLQVGMGIPRIPMTGIPMGRCQVYCTYILRWNFYGFHVGIICRSSHGNPMMGIRGISPLISLGGWDPNVAWCLRGRIVITTVFFSPLTSVKMMILQVAGWWFVMDMGVWFDSKLRVPSLEANWENIFNDILSKFPYWWCFILGTNHVFFCDFLNMILHTLLMHTLTCFVSMIRKISSWTDEGAHCIHVFAAKTEAATDHISILLSVSQSRGPQHYIFIPLSTYHADPQFAAWKLHKGSEKTKKATQYTYTNTYYTY